MFTNVIPQITSVKYIHHQIQVFPVLKSVVHVDYEGIVQLSENLTLIHDRFNASFCNNSGFRHFLHGILLFRFLSFNLPYFSKASFSDAVQVCEVAFRQGYIGQGLEQKLLIIPVTFSVSNSVLKWQFPISLLIDNYYYDLYLEI